MLPFPTRAVVTAADSGIVVAADNSSDAAAHDGSAVTAHNGSVAAAANGSLTAWPTTRAAVIPLATTAAGLPLPTWQRS